MDNNVVCPNCGNSNKGNNDFCLVCGNSLKQNSNEVNEQSDFQYEKVHQNNNVINEQSDFKNQTNNGVANNQINNVVVNSQANNNIVNNQINNDDSEGNKLGIIALLLCFGEPFLVLFISFLLSGVNDVFTVLCALGPLAGIVFMIIGVTKYPINKFLKIVMWIFIGLYILAMVLIVLFIGWCFSSCASSGIY